MKEGVQDKWSSCKGADGDIVSDDADILSRWQEYFQKLYGMTEGNLEMSLQWTALPVDTLKNYHYLPWRR